MKIHFDLDGILRDLCTPTLGYEPEEWHHVTEKGDSIIDILERDLCIFAKAPPTEYFEYIVENHTPICIITNQKDHWKPYTWQWLHENFGDIPFEVFYYKPEEKLQFVGENYIVEDYPFFDNYDNIILIDKPYNRQVKAKIRVKNIKELDRILKGLE